MFDIEVFIWDVVKALSVSTSWNKSAGQDGNGLLCLIYNDILSQTKIQKSLNYLFIILMGHSIAYILK